MSPPLTLSPTLAVGLNSHSFTLSNAGTSIPLGMKSPDTLLISSNGL